MKSFLLKSITLVSHVERKAKEISFHPRFTVIKGDNDTGKSCLIKSIFHVFGAEPHGLHKDWLQAQVKILLAFEIEGKQYYAFKDGSFHSLFDEEENLIGNYESITNGLTPILANLLDIEFTLTNRQGIPCIPPPNYLFLPFYIDQDKGWNEPWNSFTRLGQFANWKESLVEYFLGMKSNKWFKTDAEKRSLQAERVRPELQLGSIEELLSEKRLIAAAAGFDMDIDQFKKDIDFLLLKCNELKKHEDLYVITIQELNNRKISLLNQIKITNNSKKELDDDYEYALENLEDFVDCPTCGTRHEDLFSERFKIARDSEACAELLDSLKLDLVEVRNRIKTAEKKLLDLRLEHDSLKEILSRKQGQLQLQDLLDQQGKKALIKELQSEQSRLRTVLFEIDQKIEDLTKTLEKLRNKEQQKLIKERYASLFYSISQNLNVSSLEENTFKKINPNIRESGSDLPRAILAYRQTIASLMIENDDISFFPLVIDAPNQQEQDKENLLNILNHLKSGTPDNTQLIIGLVDDGNIEFSESIINLERKKSLLDENVYETLSKRIERFEDRLLQDFKLEA